MPIKVCNTEVTFIPKGSDYPKINITHFTSNKRYQKKVQLRGEALFVGKKIY